MDNDDNDRDFFDLLNTPTYDFSTVNQTELLDLALQLQLQTANNNPLQDTDPTHETGTGLLEQLASVGGEEEEEHPLPDQTGTTTDDATTDQTTTVTDATTAATDDTTGITTDDATTTAVTTVQCLEGIGVRGLLMSLIALLGATPSPVRAILKSLVTLLDSRPLPVSEAAEIVQAVCQKYLDRTQQTQQTTKTTTTTTTTRQTKKKRTKRADMMDDAEWQRRTERADRDAEADWRRRTARPRSKPVRREGRTTTWYLCKLCAYKTPRSHDMTRHFVSRHGATSTSLAEMSETVSRIAPRGPRQNPK